MIEILDCCCVEIVLREFEVELWVLFEVMIDIVIVFDF